MRLPLEGGPPLIHPAPCPAGLDVTALGFDPPLACPYCTVDKLCHADGRKELYKEDCSGMKLMYPQVTVPTAGPPARIVGWNLLQRRRRRQGQRWQWR